MMSSQVDTKASSTANIALRGMYLGRKLDLRRLRGRENLGSFPFVMKTGENGSAVLFRYGVLVAVDLTEEETEELKRELSPHISGSFEQPETELLNIRIDADEEEGLDESGVLWLRSAAPERIRLVAEVLAKSVVLAHYEGEIAKAFERIEPMAEGMVLGNRPPGRKQVLYTELGEAILAQTRTIGRVETGDKPEVTWENPDLDRLYMMLAKEYELEDRDKIFHRKSALVSDTTGLFIDLLTQRQSIRVEWYIVILIVIEIVLILYELAVLA